MSGAELKKELEEDGKGAFLKAVSQLFRSLS
jgi:hypothetical protein